MEWELRSVKKKLFFNKGGMMPFDFSKTTTTKKEFILISKIVKRAHEMEPSIDTMSLNMDLTATHELTPLKLEDLLKADDFNFAHDVFGIMRHINRVSGKLEHCFVPRFTAK